MATHDPLTTAQLSLLAEIAEKPAIISTHDQVNTDRGRDIAWLQQLGYLSIGSENMSQDATRCTWIYSRSGKVLE